MFYQIESLPVLDIQNFIHEKVYHTFPYFHRSTPRIVTEPGQPLYMSKQLAVIIAVMEASHSFFASKSYSPLKQNVPSE